MQKKALLIALTDYRGYVPAPAGPANDIVEWDALLTKKYGFTTTKLVNLTATRTAILDGFQNLLKGTAAGDAIVALFAGHGKVVTAHQGETELPFEEALIAYPKEGDTTLSEAEITSSDLLKIIKEANPASGVLFSIILDACFSGYFGSRRSAGNEYAIPLAITPLKTRGFGLFDVGYLKDVDLRPMIVAAAGRDETAVEVTAKDGRRRLLFSNRAIDWLRQHDDVTFKSLVFDIRPLAPGPGVQTPELRGDTSREDALFPDGRDLSGGSIVQPNPPQPRPMPIGAPMYTLDVRFKGICCFADAVASGNSYKKRVLLPYDARTGDLVKHIAFIEVAKDLIDWSAGDPGGNPSIGPHYPGGVDFYRWDLHGHRIDFTNAADSSFQVASSYRPHVPGLRYDICPELDYHPREECFYQTPPSNLVAAFIDLNVGTLSAGPLQNIATKFTRSGGEETWRGRTASFVDLQVPLDDPGATITLDDGKTTPIVIYLVPGASVLIGNMRKIDIFGDPKAIDDPRESFQLFYNLSRIYIADGPLPAGVEVPIDGCSSTGWP